MTTTAQRYSVGETFSGKVLVYDDTFDELAAEVYLDNKEMSLQAAQVLCDWLNAQSGEKPPKPVQHRHTCDKVGENDCRACWPDDAPIEVE